jgi:hypothetical protein
MLVLLDQSDLGVVFGRCRRRMRTGNESGCYIEIGVGIRSVLTLVFETLNVCENGSG